MKAHVVQLWNAQLICKIMQNNREIEHHEELDADCST